MRILFITLVAFLISCAERPRLVTSEPKVEDIVGRYYLAKTLFTDAVDSEARSKAKNSFIELREDSTMTMNNIPIIPDDNDYNFSLERFHTSEGTFSIAPLGSTSKHVFYGLYLSCGDLPDPFPHPRLGTYLDDYVLTYEYFDGNFIERMRFDRKPE